MQNLSDEQLVKLAVKDNQEAIETLISRYLKPVYGFVYHFTGRAFDAEDIAQEVFVKVWQNLKKFNHQKKFKTWLFAIAKNAAIDFLRKKKAIPFSEFTDEDGGNMITETLADPAPLPPEIFDRQNLAEELTAAIAKLSPKYRLVLLLHYNEQLTIKEISESLNEPLDTIKSRNRRAIIELRKLLTEY